MDQQIYDSILDALDSSNIDLLHNLFTKYNLTPFSNLYDAPRITGFNNSILNTYIDYILYHNLVDILQNYIIDNSILPIDDDIICNALKLNFEIFDYIIYLGKFIPGEKTIKYAVQNCLSQKVEMILLMDNDLIDFIDNDDIEYLFSFDIDEETAKTIRVLFNYKIDKNLFVKYLDALKEPNNTYFNITEEEQNAAIEIIDFLEMEINK